VPARIGRRLSRSVARVDHWRIGWRWTGADLVRDRLGWPDARYEFLADDGERYFAAPFVFMHEGVAHVFCEDYPYATRKGIISHFTVSREGDASAARRCSSSPTTCPTRSGSPRTVRSG
jgi:hypothetical protein